MAHRLLIFTPLVNIDANVTTIFTEFLKFIEVKVSHIPSHFSPEHFDISIIEIGPRGKILLKKYKGVPIL